MQHQPRGSHVARTPGRPDHGDRDGIDQHLPDGPLEAVEELVEAVKPHLRGWLHLGMVPAVLAAGVALVAIAPTGRARVAAAVFVGTALLLFGISALYHRGHWSSRAAAVLKRLDHSNIFLIIAGSYTPFALLLPGPTDRQLLGIVWVGAIAGVLFRVLWVHAPRWLYTPIYVALGWVAIFYLVPLWRHGGTTIVALIALGGILYTLGAVVYGTKRPDPSPRWFGFHEVFHTFTVLAFASHYAAAWLTMTGPLSGTA